MSDSDPRFGFLERGYVFDVTATGTEVVTLDIPTRYAGFFGISYNTPNGNRATDFGNQVLVFEGGSSMRTPGPLAGASPVIPNGGAIVYPFSGQFASVPYLCAYSVGPHSSADGGSYPNIAATSYLEGGVGRGKAVLTAPSLGVETAHSSFIVWNYSLPPGVNPRQNGAWIGLWQGDGIPYEVAPYRFAPIAASESAGMTPMLHVRLAGKSAYVGALFTSGYHEDAGKLQLTAIAAIVRFVTSAPH